MSYKDNIIREDVKKHIFKRIGKTAFRHWKLMTGFLVAIMSCGMLESYATYLTKDLLDEGILAGNLDVTINFTIRFLIIHLIIAASMFLFIYFAGLMGEKIRFDLRKFLFDHLQELTYSFFDKNNSGWLMSRITSDTSRIAELSTWMLLDAVWGIANIISSLIFMSMINVYLALIVLALIPLLLFIAVKFQKLLIKEYRNVRALNSRITSAYSENIGGVKIIKALVKEKHNLHNFSGLAGNMYKASFRAAWLSSLFLPAIQIITSLGVGLLLYAGGWNIAIGVLTIGGLRAFISYMSSMLWPIQDMARVFSEMQQSIASAERVYSLLETPPEIVDSPDSRTIPGIADKGCFEGNIEFKNINFHYKEGEAVLKDFSLKVNKGESIAIVGPTGSGKTTIVNLLSRYYEPVSGSILIDGEDYHNWTQKALQSRIGVVLQKPHLFSGSVRDNILYGKPDATEKEFDDAIRLSAAWEMINRLPDGLDEEVGEAGDLLSQGQRQLISMARTIIADPDIIVMDEATSSIDTLTEQALQEGISGLLKGRTSFVIAHRLSTIRNANRILVIEKGKITEEGSHKELLRQKKHYYQLYTNQYMNETRNSLLA